MPMEIADLKAQAEAGLSITPGTQKAAALRVLVTNPETAFTPKEIAARTDIPADNAPTVCKRLAEMGAASNENGHYYLTQDDVTADAVRRALGSAHQQDMARKTAAADERTLETGSDDSDSGSLSDAEVATEVAELDDELPDV